MDDNSSAHLHSSATAQPSTATPHGNGARDGGFASRSLLKVLDFVKNNLAYLIPIALFSGLQKGHHAPMEYSRAICVSALLIMIFPVFVNLEFGKGVKELRGHRGVLTVAALFNFFLYPMIALGLGWLLLRDQPAMWLGLVMLSLVPTSGMTINWTYFTKGNMHVAMGIVASGILVSVVLLPFAIPLAAEFLMRADQVDVDRLVILEKLFFVIVLPIIFGTVVRHMVIRIKGPEVYQALKPINSGISAVGVLVVSFLVMSLESTQTMVTRFSVLGEAMLPVVLFYAVVFLMSHFASGRFSHPDTGKSFFFGTAARYHVITLGVALGSFKDYDFVGAVVLPIAIGLAVQIPALAFYARWIQRRGASRELQILTLSLATATERDLET